MKIHQIVKAKVVEVLPDGSVIMSFKGSLVRVVNKTNEDYAEGKTVSLRVTKLQPLEFQFLSRD